MSLERLKERERYVKQTQFFPWHALSVLGSDPGLEGPLGPRNPQEKISVFPSVELNYFGTLFLKLCNFVLNYLESHRMSVEPF